MKSFLSLIVSFLITASAAEAQLLEPFGLQGKTVTAMTFYGGSLYATTDNDGVYRRYLGKPDSGWIHLGTPAKNLTSIFAFHTYCPLRCWKGVLAGTTLNPAQSDSALVYFYQQRPDTCQQQGNWAVADSGINRTSVTRINALGGIDVCHPIAPTYVTAFAGTPGAIWRSEDRGKSWKQVWQAAAAEIFALAAKPRSLLASDDEIWAGGSMLSILGLRQPLVLRSTDAGQSWQEVGPNVFAQNDACQALALHPADTNIVYAALMHSLLKSNNRGKSWQATYFGEFEVVFRALAVNPQQPKQIFAGGAAGERPGGFMLYESKDAGEHWKFVFGDIRLGPINSLVFDPVDSQHVYIATLRTGVYRYPRVTAGVENELTTPKSFYLSPASRIHFILLKTCRWRFVSTFPRRAR